MTKYDFFNTARKVFYSAVLGSLVLFGAEKGLESLTSYKQNVTYAQSRGPEVLDIFRHKKTPFRQSIEDAQRVCEKAKNKELKQRIYEDRMWFGAYDVLLNFALEGDETNETLLKARSSLDNLNILDTNQTKYFESQVVPVALAGFDTKPITPYNEFTNRVSTDTMNCSTNKQGDDLAHRLCWISSVDGWHTSPDGYDELGKFILTRGVPSTYDLPIMPGDSILFKYFGDGSEYVFKKDKSGIDWRFFKSDIKSFINYAETKGKFFLTSEFSPLEKILISGAGPFPLEYYEDALLSVLDIRGNLENIWTEKVDSNRKKHKSIDLNVKNIVWGFSDTGWVLLHNDSLKKNLDVYGANGKDDFYLGIDVGPFSPGKFSQFKQGTEITKYGKEEQVKSQVFQWEFSKGIPNYAMIVERDTVIVNNRLKRGLNEKDTTYLHTTRKSKIPPLESRIVNSGEDITIGFPLFYTGSERGSNVTDTVKIYLSSAQEREPDTASESLDKGRFEKPMYWSVPSRYLETAISLGAKIDTFNVNGALKYDISSSEAVKLAKKLKEKRNTGENIEFEAEPDTTILSSAIIESSSDTTTYKNNPFFVIPVNMNGDRYKWFNHSFMIPEGLYGDYSISAFYNPTSSNESVSNGNTAYMKVKIE
ncbi:MAG: hypothetical protein AABW50_02375 [Nanoarchaeota archaeon]